MRPKSNAPIGSMQIIQSALEELIIRLLRKDHSKTVEQAQGLIHYEDKLTNDVIVFLREHLNTRFSLTDLSAKMGYGKTVLCTQFKAVTGKTIFTFLAELRVEEAKKMILDKKSFTNSAISDALGFSEPAYFCNVFKKITGMSPKEYSRMIHAFDKK